MKCGQEPFYRSPDLVPWVTFASYCLESATVTTAGVQKIPEITDTCIHIACIFLMGLLASPLQKIRMSSKYARERQRAGGTGGNGPQYG